MVITFGTPVLVALASFGLHTVTSPKKGLTPADAFTAIALFNVLRNPLRMLPKIIPAMMDAVVAHEVSDYSCLPRSLSRSHPLSSLRTSNSASVISSCYPARW